MIEYSEIEAISKSGKGKGMYQASRKMMEHYKMLEKKKICQDIELEERWKYSIFNILYKIFKFVL